MYDIVIRQYRTIFIACVTLKVVQLFIVQQKLSDIEHVRFFLVRYRRNAAM